MNPKLLRILPLIVLLVLALALATGLFSKPPKHEARLVGYHLSAFNLPALGQNARFTPNIWKGRVVILNIFASWCQPCAEENDTLMKIARSGKVAVYGIAWKDKAEDVASFLRARGNPYQMIGLDQQGETTIPLALTGVPETFVIDKDGSIFYQYDGPLTDKLADTLILPLVDRLNQGNVKVK